MLDSIESAIEDIRNGKIVIVVDDEDRENEGDFICSAELVTPEMINFMATKGRGLICTPIEEKRADELGLMPMVTSNNAMHETAFTISIDMLGEGCSTGISAYDRATGIRHMTNPKAKSTDYARPGHIFPLRAKSGGVLRRTGHTEAAVDLAKLAGLYPAGVLVEILNEDGTMARLPDLLILAKQLDMRIISIDDLVAYRIKHESLLRRDLEVEMDTVFGTFQVIALTDVTTNDTHIALKKGDWSPEEPVFVRVYSGSETGDILGTLLHDYGHQNHLALRTIERAGKGVFVFMRQQEKHFQILHKLQQYAEHKQQSNLEQFDLTMPMGQKDFGVGAQILRELGVKKMKLLTNNPRKRSGFIGFGLEIVENVDLK
jgi:3,4-dihydroxy 2-butanone 4-phosphate synthase / GTP cyclohydrolase II